MDDKTELLLKKRIENLELDKKRTEAEIKESLSLYSLGALLGGITSIPLFIIYDTFGTNIISFSVGLLISALFGLSYTVVFRDGIIEERI